MLPAAFIPLDSLPLTPNNKLDRNALPAPQNNAAPASLAYAPPRTGTETKIAAIWQELLRNARVGIYDNFFDLGGYSLLVVQLQSRLRRQFQKEISLVELFQYPTVASQASLLEPAPPPFAPSLPESLVTADA
jgi:hypothetical protein